MLPPYDEERFFCEKFNKRHRYRTQIHFPTNYRNYLEKMVVKKNLPVAFFDRVNDINSSTNEIHRAMSVVGVGA